MAEIRKLMEGEMEKQARKPVKYSRIMFVGTVIVPGNAHRHDKVLNVDGIPHAGGIDIEFQVEVGSAGIKEPRRVTVPWGKIQQADHANDG